MKQALVYPPKNGWDCPDCGKHHSKAHFAFENQVDHKKHVSEVGRVKHDREDKYSCLTGETGPKVKLDECNRLINSPLFCPHCGYLDDVTNIVKRC